MMTLWKEEREGRNDYNYNPKSYKSLTAPNNLSWPAKIYTPMCITYTQTPTYK